MRATCSKIRRQERTRESKSCFEEQSKMKTEELMRLAKSARNSMPDVERFPIATIYRTIKEHEKASLSLADLKEFILHLTGWDIPFQVIRSQLEINQIIL